MLEKLLNFTDPVFIFTLLLFIILLFPPLFKKIRLPSIIGLIIAGILIGPHTFGIIEKNSAIQLLSKIGLLYIMFLAGLEIDMMQAKKNFGNTLMFGLMTFFIPLILGILVSFFILRMNLISSILLASMFSSHTLLTYPTVSKLGITKNRSVTTTVGGTIITDILALLILAVITGSSSEKSNVFFWIKFTSLIIIYILAVIFIVPFIGKLFFKSQTRDEIIEYIFVLFLVFICSFLAHIAGLEPIIGAFLAGLILNSLIPHKSVLMNRINFIGNSLFIPIFLISVGMLVNINTLLVDKKAWLISGCMIIIAVLSKLIAALISGKLLKMKISESFLIFGLSVNQAAATLAAVIIGYDLKFFDESVLTGTIMMIAVTCFIGPFFTEFFGKKVALSQEKDELQNETRSNQRILVPISLKENIKELMELSFILYKKKSFDSIYPINIVMDDFDVEKKLIESEKLLAHAVVKSIAANVSVMPVTRVDMNVASGIIKAIRDLRISCMIAGWNGNTKILSKIFGHHIDSVLDNSNHLVIINKIVHSYRTFNRIVLLLPQLVDQQSGFEELISVIRNFAQQFQTSINIVGLEETLKNNSAIFQKLKSGIKIEFTRIKNWKNITDTLDTLIKDSDIISLFSSRVTRAAWQPLLNKLPSILSKRYYKNNIMILFPSEEKWYSREISNDSNFEELFKVINRKNIFFNLDELSINDSLNYMIYKNFEDKLDVLKRVTDLLTDIAYNEPVELLEDVVLIHAHIPDIEDYEIYIGVNKIGFEIPNISNRVKVIIVLINSIEKPAEHHLGLLKEIAQLFRTKGFIESLKNSKSIDEFESNFKKY